LARLVSCSSDFKDIGGHVANGAVVVYPTDTVYGIGSGIWSEAGAARCFEIKKRKQEKILPILVDSTETATKLVTFGRVSSSLANAFWPGKLIGLWQ
jgi:L-threonylcarbamoyladenylate synthase